MPWLKAFDPASFLGVTQRPHSEPPCSLRMHGQQRFGLSRNGFVHGQQRFGLSRNGFVL